MTRKSKADVYSQLVDQCAAYVAEVKPVIRNPVDIYRILAPLCNGETQESFYVLLLNTKNRLIGSPIRVTVGLLDCSLVHPREVFRPAISANARSVIVAHNHPSGDPDPSDEDIRITKQLIEAGKIIGIPVRDHVVVGHKTTSDDTGYISIRESGVLSFG